MWPTLIVDNFFDDPDKIINFSKQLNYKRSEDHHWPGTRSPQLDKVDKPFFDWSTKKIMMLLFPMNIEQIKWSAIQHFQKIPYKTYGKSGWIHRDYTDKKRKFFKDLKAPSSQEQWRKKANNAFEKSVDLHSNFNRLVLFDGHQWHGAENYGTEKEDRLTLITFFITVVGEGGVPIHYPVPMMRRQ